MMNERIYTFKDGRETIFDVEDAPLICQYSLTISTDGYLIMLTRGLPKRKRLRLHVVLMNPPKGMFVDHINGDKLDNRKCNLRVCTRANNGMNRGKPRTKKQPLSRFKGVTKSRNSWCVGIKYNNTYKYLGCYSDEIEAAKAYNEAAIKYHGEYAKLNIINNN